MASLVARAVFPEEKKERREKKRERERERERKGSSGG